MEKILQQKKEERPILHYLKPMRDSVIIVPTLAHSRSSSESSKGCFTFFDVCAVVIAQLAFQA